MPEKTITYSASNKENKNDKKLLAAMKNFWASFRTSISETKKVTIRSITATCDANGFEVETDKAMEIEFYNISAPDKTLGLPEKIYIRQSYKNLADQVFGNIKGATITGSPGTGKTMLLLYILKQVFDRAGKEESPKVYVDNLIPGKTFLFTRDNCELVERDLAEFAIKSNTFILMDKNCNTRFALYLAKVFLFASPAYENYRVFVKDFFAIYYLPVWSRDEVQAWDSILKLEYHDGFSALSRYSRFGGKARLIFNPEITQADIEAEINFYINSLTLETFKSLGDPYHGSEDIQSSLFSFQSELATAYKDFTLDLSSPWIEQKLIGYMSGLVSDVSSKTAKRFFAINSSSNLASVAEGVFRNLAFHILGQEESFQIQTYELKGKSDIIASKPEVKFLPLKKDEVLKFGTEHNMFLPACDAYKYVLISQHNDPPSSDGFLPKRVGLLMTAVNRGFSADIFNMLNCTIQKLVEKEQELLPLVIVTPLWELDLFIEIFFRALNQRETSWTSLNVSISFVGIDLGNQHKV